MSKEPEIVWDVLQIRSIKSAPKSVDEPMVKPRTHEFGHGVSSVQISTKIPKSGIPKILPMMCQVKPETIIRPHFTGPVLAEVFVIFF